MMSPDDENLPEPSASTTTDRRKQSESSGDDDRTTKRAKVSKQDHVYLENLPACEAYERSYMHRDVITHVLSTKTQFIITASVDGVIKFWKKTATSIDFVKTFKSHTGPIEDIAVTSSGSELASVSKRDRSVKIFDVVNFDMINMLTLDFEPGCVEWTESAATGNENLIISDSQSGTIHTFDARQSSSEPCRKLEKVHDSVVCRMRFNPFLRFVVSADVDCNLKFWRIVGSNSSHPPVINIKLDNFDNVKIHNINFSHNGEFFVTTSSDRKIRVFKAKSGKLAQEFDETLDRIQELHRQTPLMDGLSFARRMAIERELDKNQATRHENAIFDQSGHFLLYPTMMGVKIVNWRSGEQVRSLGKDETNFRPTSIGLFQGLIFEKVIRKVNIDALESGVSDPTLFASSYKKNRFYCFSNRHFEEDTLDGEGEIIKDRDIYNEKPSREEILAAIDTEQGSVSSSSRFGAVMMFENATIHTTMGDIQLKLYPKNAPKACENFCQHAKEGYFNNHIFHRVIKQFMIQTGDPTGTGTGGESIWDGDPFEDEFTDELTHENPYTLSMANCGPNTNGSQFFITVAPCPFLDKKHTIFGRVTRGMDTCLAISRVKTDPKTDKPINDIRIVNVKVFQ